MSIADLRERIPGIGEVPLIGILRRIPPESVIAVVGSAEQAGIRVVEVTLDSERALEQIHAVASEFPEMTVGAGSVRSPAQVADADDAGARFIVSPVSRQAVATACHGIGVPHIPGASTPTEVDFAMESGAVAVKVFPIEQLGGPAFLRAILSPLGDPPLIPTGGVTLSNAGDYMSAGAVAVGAGSAMFSSDLISSPDRMAEQLRGWVKVVTR